MSQLFLEAMPKEIKDREKIQPIVGEPHCPNYGEKANTLRWVYRDDAHLHPVLVCDAYPNCKERA